LSKGEEWARDKFGKGGGYPVGRGPKALFHIRLLSQVGVDVGSESQSRGKKRGGKRAKESWRDSVGGEKIRNFLTRLDILCTAHVVN